jgi:hypothetical protein
MSPARDLVGKWIAAEIDPRDRAVQNIVDLNLCSEARRALRRVLDQRGLQFFLKAGQRGPLRLDSRRIAWVVEAARRTKTPIPTDPDALSRTRRVVRRELLRQLATTLVQAGL